MMLPRTEALATPSSNIPQTNVDRILLEKFTLSTLLACIPPGPLQALRVVVLFALLMISPSMVTPREFISNKNPLENACVMVAPPTAVILPDLARVIDAAGE